MRISRTSSTEQERPSTKGLVSRGSMSGAGTANVYPRSPTCVSKIGLEHALRMQCRFTAVARSSVAKTDAAERVETSSACEATSVGGSRPRCPFFGAIGAHQKPVPSSGSYTIEPNVSLRGEKGRRRTCSAFLSSRRSYGRSRQDSQGGWVAQLAVCQERAREGI